MIHKLIPIIAVGLFAFQVVLNLELRKIDTAWIDPPTQREVKWDPRLFEALSFGHLPAAIDWLWLRSMLDPAISRIAKGTHAPIFYDLDLATDLDPAFFDAYANGANLLAVVRDDIEGAKILLEKGQRFVDQELPSYNDKFKKRYWRQVWAVPLIAAYVYLFELQDMPSADKAFRRAAEFEGAPPYLKLLSDRLKKPGGQYEVAMRLLNFMIEATDNAKSRAILEKRRESLFLGQYLFQLTAGFQEYLAQLPELKGKRPSQEEQLRKYWKLFRRDANVPDRDPWGGVIQLGVDGKITSTTPREKVYGLE